MKEVTIGLYEFDELGMMAQRRAIAEHTEFLQDIAETEEEEQLIDEEYVIESIKSWNRYLFYKDGSLANVLHYTGRHPRSGETVLIIGGEEYLITK